MRRNRRWHRRAAAGAMLLVAVSATTSIAMAASDSSQTARLSTTGRTLGFGERFSLGGRVPTDRGVSVRIRFRRAGARNWTTVRTIHTDSAGKYSTRTRARINGAFRVAPSVGLASSPDRIKVRSQTAFHVAKHDVVIGDGVRLKGRALPGGRRAVKVVIRGPHGDIVRDATSHHGGYGVRWRPRHTGAYRLRAYVGRNRLARGSGSISRRITVYRRAVASYYGPGLYGGALACGGTLQPGTMGVAHKTLPCGSKVTLRYHGRSVTVPVIDRGPYVGGRDFDLTAATKSRLGFPDLGVLLSSK
jgi:rare lipoprotein A